MLYIEALICDRPHTVMYINLSSVVVLARKKVLVSSCGSGLDLGSRLSLKSPNRFRIEGPPSILGFIVRGFNIILVYDAHCNSLISIRKNLV